MQINEQLGRLTRRIDRADSAASLREILAELLRIENDGNARDDLDELRLRAFHALMGFTEQDQQSTQDALLNDLLSLCLRTKDQWKKPRAARHYDAIFTDWLSRFSTPIKFPLRDTLLTRLIAALDGSTLERACRLIGMIGYRDERVFDRLLDLARAGSNAIRDVALHVLTVLGASPSQNDTLIRLWIERANTVPWNYDLIGAAKQLASRKILGPIFERWLTPNNLRNLDAASRILPQLAIAVPGAVAEQYSDDAELQDQIWNRLRNLESEAPELFFLRVLGSTQVAHPCDSPDIVRYYLSKLADNERAHDLAYFRLEECERPRQLLGWGKYPGEEVVQALFEDAEAATAMIGSFMSQDLRRKLHAWETLFCLGKGEALARVGPAVVNESNGHAVGAILDLAACFKLDPVPSRVRELIAGEFGGIAENDSERLSSHVSAIAVAHSSGAKSAFEALLNFNLIRQGGVLISLLDALAHATAALIRTGDANAAERLWLATASEQPKYRRAAAAAALGRLLRHNLLQPLPTERLATLIEDKTLDPYARREILEGLGYLPAEVITPQIERILRGALVDTPTAVGENGAHREADFRATALTALARLGFLATDTDALRQHLGLRQYEQTCGWEGAPVLPGTSVVLGILYTHEPDRFAPAVAALLSKGDWTVVVQLAPFLRSGPYPASDLIVGAVLERLRHSGPEMGEPDLISLLADIAPGRIAAESWDGMFGWPPQMRAALAEAIARHPSTDNFDRSMNLLLVLMGDGQYGVRRAAFRAMARLSPDDLHSVCTAWAMLTEANAQPNQQSYLIDMRRRAAEAGAWLEPIPIEGPVAALAYDPEPEVRETFARCRRERHERDWAAEYLRRVLAVCDNTSLLSEWKYGRALQRLGDDYVLEQLEARRRENLPPGVRHWLGRLIKKLRTRWDEVTRSWPEPWFARRGRLERVIAAFGDNEAKAKQVSCWLWQVPPSNLGEFGVWGGWCVGEILPVSMQTLRVPERRQATILVTQGISASSGSGPSYFIGSGPYPERVS